jgi:hypothetical protein
MLERKDRVTHGGMIRMEASLNKLIDNTEIAKWLILKRIHEISARMTLMHLKPGQRINLEEASMYIVLDGKVRISNHEQHALEAT